MTGARDSASAITSQSARSAPSHAPSSRWATVMDCVVIAAGASALTAWLYRVWDRDLAIPIDGVADGRQMSALVKTIADHGWYLQNPDLGAPFGQQLYDFPNAGETTQILAIRVLTLFTDRFGLVVNSYYLLGFSAVAVVAYLAFRSLRFTRLIAAALSLLYAFLPYHFSHGESHLLRSTYVSAPIACLIALWVLSYRTKLLRDPAGPWRPWTALRGNVNWPRVAMLCAMAVAVSLTETMTTFFLAVLVVLASLLNASRERSLCAIVPGVLVVSVLAGTFALALTPNLLYWRDVGRNPVAAKRIAIEQELYGLKLSQLMLPIDEHRSQTLRSVQRDAVDQTPVPSEGGQQLGLIGALGLVGLLVGIVTRGIPKRLDRALEARDVLWRASGLLALILMLCATISGFAFLASMFGLAQIRVWNRVVVLIAFFALIGAGIGIERVQSRLAHRGAAGRAAGVALIGAVLAFGLWDTAVPVQIDGPEEIEQNSIAAAFTLDLEERLPSSAALFQLPANQFPEVDPTGRARDYENFLPYLWSSDLRWSYGAMKGRPEGDWIQRVDSDDPLLSLAGLAGLGFAGVVVDGLGYEDGGVAVAERLTRTLGSPDVVSSGDARWRFWSLRDYAPNSGLSMEELRRAAQTLIGPELVVPTNE